MDYPNRVCKVCGEDKNMYGGCRCNGYTTAFNTVENQHIPQHRKACNNAVGVQCLRCGEWFINIDGCPNGCRAGVTTAIA